MLVEKFKKIVTFPILFKSFVQATSVIANMDILLIWIYPAFGRHQSDGGRLFLPVLTVISSAETILSKALDRVCRPDETAMNFKCRPFRRRSARDDGDGRPPRHLLRPFS